jgi:aryl-alcohol dehydrogenase-like predicted oxidoreductase
VDQRPLGHSKLAVSVVGLGCNNFGRRLDAAATRAVVDAALDAGITFLDTADAYGNGASERFLGEALRGRRDRVVLATKFGLDAGDANGPAPGPRGSAAYIRQAFQGSLERLGTDHIDLYQYHRPDGVTPIAETLRALHELVTEGRVRAIGCSNFTAAQIEEADHVASAHGLTRFTSVQNEYSLLRRDVEAEITPACERLDLAIIPYFPLASGLLTGKYRRGEPAPTGTRLAERERVGSDADFDRVEALERFADARGISLLDVAIGGLAAQPRVASVIAGATRPEQAAANAAAAGWRPSAEEVTELAAIAPPPAG